MVNYWEEKDYLKEIVDAFNGVYETDLDFKSLSSEDKYEISAFCDRYGFITPDEVIR